MEERIKLLEGKVEALYAVVAQMDKALGVAVQWLMVNKTFMDTLKVNTPPAANEVIKPEDVK